MTGVLSEYQYGIAKISGFPEVGSGSRAVKRATVGMYIFRLLVSRINDRASRADAAGRNVRDPANSSRGLDVETAPASPRQLVADE